MSLDNVEKSYLQFQGCSKEDRKEALLSLLEVTDDDDHCRAFFTTKEEFLHLVYNEVLNNASTPENLLLYLKMLHHLCRSNDIASWYKKNISGFMDKIVELMLDTSCPIEEVQERACVLMNVAYQQDDADKRKLIADKMPQIENIFLNVALLRRIALSYALVE